MVDVTERLPATENITQKIPGYRIIRELGRGGMSAVYLADDLSLPRKVALKVLSPSLAKDEHFRKRFTRESHVLCELDHPHIIPIYSAGEAGELLYLAMRYVDSGDLRALLGARGPFSLPQAANVIRQVADALDVAHAKGLIHRDVKPENILVDQRSSVREHCYLADFGITKNISGESFTIARQFIGSVYYAAPEQIEAKSVDGRADVYALGCVLYQCLSGQVPFPRDNTAAVLMAHVRDAPPSISGRRPDLPPGIDRIITKALAKQPGDRYATCGELAAALVEVTLGDPRPTIWQNMERDSPTVVVDEQATPFHRRWPLIAGASAMALALVAILAAWKAIQFPNQQEAALRDRMPAAFRDTCVRDGQSPAVKGRLAALRCEPHEGADEATYASFASASALGQAYEQVSRDAGVEQAITSDCETSERAEHPYEGSRGVTGRVTCYRQAGSSYLVWTNDTTRLLATARRDDGESPMMYAWWQGLVGRPVFPTPDEQALLDEVPVETNVVDCHHAHDLADYPGAIAGVQCGTMSRVEFVSYYRFNDLAGMNVIFDGRVRELNAPDVFCGDVPPNFLGEGYFNYTESESEIGTGRVACHTSPQGDPVIEWTHESLLVFAVASGGDPNALIDFWNDAGPVQEAALFPTPVEQALLNSLPPAVQATCVRATDVADFPGVIAGVRCGPTSGAQATWYYLFPDQASMRGVYTLRYRVVGPPNGLACDQSPLGLRRRAHTSLATPTVNVSSATPIQMGTRGSSGFKTAAWSSVKRSAPIRTRSSGGGQIKKSRGSTTGLRPAP
jgi:hypothetical protein